MRKILWFLVLGAAIALLGQVEAAPATQLVAASTSSIVSGTQPLTPTVWLPMAIGNPDPTIVTQVETPDGQERYRLVRASDGTLCRWSFLFYVQTEGDASYIWNTCIHMIMKGPPGSVVKIWVRPDRYDYPTGPYSELTWFSGYWRRADTGLPTMSVLKLDGTWTGFQPFYAYDEIKFSIDTPERRWEVRPDGSETRIWLGYGTGTE